jgi:hypothetical protein
MNFLNLPDDIIITIIDDMNCDMLAVSTVNKELNLLSYERIQREKEKYNRKIAFYEKCSNEGTKNFFWNGFNNTTTTEECDFLYTKYSEKFGKETFFSRIVYIIRDTYQIAAETWTQWLSINNPIIF